MSGLPARLARTGVRPSALGLGGASLGNLYQAIDDEQAAATVDAAWAGGVRLFDTAPHYGLGLSERRLGAALRDRPRDEYVLSTKVGRLLVPNERPVGTDMATLFDVPDDHRREFDFSASGVRRSLEESLTRLGLDRVDVVLVHDPDDHLDQAVAEAVPELVRMREEGLVRAVGVGMNQWQAPLRVVRETDVDVVMVAGRWTLLDRSAQPLLDACADAGVAVLAAAPFNSGLLATDDPGPSHRMDYAAPDERLLRAAQELAAAARAHGGTLPAAALQFPGRHPAVASVVVGCADARQVEAALDALGRPLDDAFWPAAEAVLAAR